MELELVSIKECSGGFSGNGWQQCWFCLIIQINDDQQRAGVPRLPDHKLTNSRLLRGHLEDCLKESILLFQFSSWDPQRCVI